MNTEAHQYVRVDIVCVGILEVLPFLRRVGCRVTGLVSGRMSSTSHDELCAGDGSRR